MRMGMMAWDGKGGCDGLHGCGILLFMKSSLNTAIACAVLILGHASAHASADPDARRAVIVRVAELLQTRYVDAARGRDLARQIRRDFEAQGWQDISGDEAFAKTVTARLRALSNDGHLSLDYSAKALSPYSDAAEDAFGKVPEARALEKALELAKQRL
jgi:hypothetical protein